MVLHQPLAEASSEEIIARVTYQIILADYRADPEAYDDPTSRVFALALEYQHAHVGVIAAQLDLVAIWCAHGGTIASWLTYRILPTSIATIERRRKG